MWDAVRHQVPLSECGPFPPKCRRQLSREIRCCETRDSTMQMLEAVNNHVLVQGDSAPCGLEHPSARWEPAGSRFLLSWTGHQQ